MRLMLRVLLWPASVIYGLIVRFRNHLYQIGYKKSFSFETNLISVGNLSVGGNGKTPMVEYLIRLLKTNYQLAVLSRGYGRSTGGFRMANPGDQASDIGDEPLQMFLKFQPELTVAVGESRELAIPTILLEKPDVQTIILDDAFQHRAVKPQFSILVTDYWAAFFNDFLLPAGRLREPRKGVGRADVVVVTKCPPEIGLEKRQEYTVQVQKYHTGLPVFFTSIRYLNPLHFISGTMLSGNPSVLLFSGIANSSTLVRYVSNRFKLGEHMRFRDHFQYGKKDIIRLKRRFAKLSWDQKILLTTEKDMVRLLKFSEMLRDLPLYYLPIECSFIDKRDEFDETVLNSMKSFHNSKV